MMLTMACMGTLLVCLLRILANEYHQNNAIFTAEHVYAGNPGDMFSDLVISHNKLVIYN